MHVPSRKVSNLSKKHENLVWLCSFLKFQGDDKTYSLYRDAAGKLILKGGGGLSFLGKVKVRNLVFPHRTPTDADHEMNAHIRHPALSKGAGIRTGIDCAACACCGGDLGHKSNATLIFAPKRSALKNRV